MNKKGFAVLLVLVAFLSGCEMLTLLDQADGAKEKASLVFYSKSKLVTNAKDGYEEDDSSSAAKQITIGELQEHNYYDDANDWLYFSAESGKEYILESWVYSSADTKLYLYNSSLSQLEYNDDKGDGSYGSKITWTAPSTGTYYIKSNSYNNNTGNNRGYEISVTTDTIIVGDEDAYEEDDSSSAASTIALNEVQNHNFYDDANDWVKIVAESGYIYTFESTVSGSADTYFYLYNSSLTEIATNDDGGTGYASKIEYTCTSSGTYYLKVYSYSGKTGEDRDYTLTVSRTDGPEELTLPMAQKSWTILVYLDADNNLSSYGTSDVQEMMGVGSSNDFNIVVLWDNSGSKHGYYYIQSGEATLVQDLGEVNMGSQTTATDFIDWAVTNFPADNYMLDYWNHGGAVDRSGNITPRGVAWDDTNGGDWLTETEQKNIIEFFYNKIGRKIDIVSYDACLMATAEIAYMYDGYADYLVASEETEPGDGWDYDFLNTVKNNPSVSAKALSQSILNYYMSWYSSSNDVTFSVIDIAYASALVSALDTFCDAAINTGNGSRYNGFTSGVADFSGYTKDLYGYLENVTNSSSVSSTIKGYAQNVMDIITDDLVVYEDHGSSWNNEAYGVSITMKSDTSTYSLLDICQDSSWDEFLTFCNF